MDMSWLVTVSRYGNDGNMMCFDPLERAETIWIWPQNDPPGWRRDQQTMEIIGNMCVRGFGSGPFYCRKHPTEMQQPVAMLPMGNQFYHAL